MGVILLHTLTPPNAFVLMTGSPGFSSISKRYTQKTSRIMMDQLPTELLIEIVSDLDYLSLIRLQRVCHRFNNIILANANDKLAVALHRRSPSAKERPPLCGSEVEYFTLHPYISRLLINPAMSTLPKSMDDVAFKSPSSLESLEYLKSNKIANELAFSLPIANPHSSDNVVNLTTNHVWILLSGNNRKQTPTMTVMRFVSKLMELEEWWGQLRRWFGLGEECGKDCMRWFTELHEIHSGKLLLAEQPDGRQTFFFPVGDPAEGYLVKRL